MASGYITMPPSTTRTCPVMYVARSDARKATAAATSCGVPSLSSAICLPRPSLASGVIAAVISVSMNPGATAFTRMLREPSSLATDLVSAIRPAVAARARAAAARDKLPGRVRGGRCPQRLDQAGRIRGRRGLDGDQAGLGVSGRRPRSGPPSRAGCAARRLSGARNDLLLTEPAVMTVVEIAIEEGIPREEPA